MALLCGDDILVPIRIDFTHKGIHYIDSFTWNIYNSILTIEEFVVKLCSDLNFPVTMIPIISSQIQQQVDSYFLLFSLFYHSNSLLFFQEISKYLSSAPIIELTIRHNVLEYSDKFQYNPYTNCCSPEKFAQITCCDLGLPPEMEPTIAFNIRETLLKYSSVKIFF